MRIAKTNAMSTSPGISPRKPRRPPCFSRRFFGSGSSSDWRSSVRIRERVPAWVAKRGSRRHTRARSREDELDLHGLERGPHLVSQADAEPRARAEAWEIGR